MEWLKYLEKCDPVQVLLMVVIFWLMRQNSGLTKEIFAFSATVTKLTTLLEGLTYGNTGTGNTDGR